jgi:FixJ family two-component response regulator
MERAGADPYAATMSNVAALIHVVDDEEAVRRALKRLFRSAGLRVETFGSGAAFLDAIMARNVPDCVVLDIRMPTITGFDVLARLKAASFAIPVIFITALDEPGDEERAMQCGAFAFLRKAVDEAALMTTVERAVEERHRTSPRGLDATRSPTAG